MTMQDIAEPLEDEIQALRAELAELRAEVRAAKPAPAPAADTRPAEEPVVAVTERVTDRRTMLRRAGVGAAAAVAGGTALALNQAGPAAAANGSSLIIGNNGPSSNTGSATTELRTSAAGTAGMFLVQDGTTTFSLFPAAITGLTNGTAATHGVYGGTTANNGTGVVGIGNGTGGVGVFASGDDIDLRLGGLGAEPSQANPDRGGFAFTANNNLWFCPVNAAGNWFKLAGPGVAGSLHMLNVPVRIYDSRPGTTPLQPSGLKGKFVDHQEKVLDTKNNSTGVPAGARAVLINATATNTNPGGYFSFWKSGAWPNTSSLNWGVANTTVASTTVVAIDSAQSFRVRMEGAGGADLVVDVIGYYL
jgi:hypothetical protein